MRPPVAPTGWPSEIPEPLTLSRSKSLVGEAPLAGAGEDLGGERLVELDQVDLVEASARRGRAPSRSPAPGRCPSSRGGTPADRPADQPAERAAGPARSARSGVVTRQAAAASFWPLALPAVTVASGSSAASTGRSLASASSVVSARGCSSRSTSDRLAAALRHLDRDDLVGEAAVLLGGDGALVGAQRQLVLRLALDPVLGAGGSPPSRSSRRAPGWSRPPAVTAGAGQAVVAASAPPAARAPARLRRVELDLAHALGAAGDDQLAGAGLHLHRRVDDRLQAGAAAPVELQPGDLDREARRRGRRRGRSPAPRRSGSTGRRRRRRPGSGRSRSARRAPARTVAASSVAGDVAEDAAEAPDRRSQRLADDRLPDRLAREHPRQSMGPGAPPMGRYVKACLTYRPIGPRRGR